MLFWRGTCTPMFIAGQSTIAKVWKEPRCPPTDEWIKMWTIRAMEYDSAIKKNEILPFATTLMELKCIMLSKTVRQRKISCDFTHMWNLRNTTDEHRGREGRIR